LTVKPVSVGEALTHPEPAAFVAWQASRPQWRPIADYEGGDVLLRFEDSLDDIVYGTRKPDGAWVYWFDGEEVRLDEEYSETFRNLDAQGNEILTDGICESYTVTRPARVPTEFCDISPEAAVHFMAL
jgi:hypothetical protein